MSLLREIYEDAMGTEVPLVAVLRKCKVLAFRLDYAPLAAWVDLELGGYPDSASLPDYRVFPVDVLGDFVGPAGASASNIPIGPSAIPEALAQYRDDLFTANISQGIASIEDLVDTGGASVRLPWSQSVLPHIHGRVLIDLFQCIQAWRNLPRGAMVGVLDAVRNRALTFSLEIEALNPAAGDTEPGGRPLVAAEDVRTIAVNVFGHGNVLAVGDQARVQDVVTVSKGDWASLQSRLASVGLDAEALNALRTALADDAETTDSLGQETRGWLTRLKDGAAAGVVSVAPEVVGNVVGGAILQYLGIA